MGMVATSLTMVHKKTRCPFCNGLMDARSKHCLFCEAKARKAAREAKSNDLVEIIGLDAQMEQFRKRSAQWQITLEYYRKGEYND